MSRYKLKIYLEELYNLLQEEKNALIKDEGEKIEDLLGEKSLLIEEIQGCEYRVSRDDIELISLKEEIDSIQELNLLLTKQALSYQQAMLESIAKNIKNVSNTYSEKGQYNKSESINLINQKV